MAPGVIACTVQLHDHQLGCNVGQYSCTIGRALTALFGPDQPAFTRSLQRLNRQPNSAYIRLVGGCLHQHCTLHGLAVSLHVRMTCKTIIALALAQGLSWQATVMCMHMKRIARTSPRFAHVSLWACPFCLLVTSSSAYTCNVKVLPHSIHLLLLLARGTVTGRPASLSVGGCQTARHHGRRAETTDSTS